MNYFKKMRPQLLVFGPLALFEWFKDLIIFKIGINLAFLYFRYPSGNYIKLQGNEEFMPKLRNKTKLR